MDSWFVPAFSAVAESEAILKQVIPYDQGFSEVNKYAGIFRFRFWFGRWIGQYSTIFCLTIFLIVLLVKKTID